MKERAREDCEMAKLREIMVTKITGRPVRK